MLNSNFADRVRNDRRLADLMARASLAESLAALPELRKVGALAEVSRELTGDRLGLNEILVPFGVLRADVVAGGTAGGYLVPTEVADPVEALRDDSALLKTAIQVLPAVGNLSVPVEKTAVAASTLATETSAATESDVTWGQANLTPTTLAGYSEVSRLLLLQTSAERYVRRNVSTSVAKALDKFGIGRALSGATGTFSGASLSWAGIIQAQAALGNSLNDSLAMLAARSVASTLAQRSKFSASGYSTGTVLWEGSLVNGQVGNAPAYSTNAIAASTGIIGSFSYCTLALWDGGVVINANKYDRTNFQSGIVGFRAMVTADVVVTRPDAFSTSTTIS